MKTCVPLGNSQSDIRKLNITRYDYVEKQKIYK